MQQKDNVEELKKNSSEEASEAQSEQMQYARGYIKYSGYDFF